MGKTRSLFVFFCSALACSALANNAHANGGPGDKTFGLGIQLGVPLGITGKVFFGEVPALAFGVGITAPYAGFGGWADLDLHFLQIRHRREDILRMSLYTGPGLQAGFGGAYYYSVYRGRVYPDGSVAYYSPLYAGPPAIAIRGPFGFAIHWQRVTFDTYVELVPSLFILPGVFFAMQGDIGARYYF